MIYKMIHLYNLNTMTGEELKKLRLKANLTQSELGSIIGVAYTKISQWENGKHKISNAYLRVLKQYFKIKD